MRILALVNKGTNEKTAFIAVDIEYDEGVSGVSFQCVTCDGESVYYYIEDVSITDCNWICEKAAVTGYCDVTSFGELMEY